MRSLIWKVVSSLDELNEHHDQATENPMKTNTSLFRSIAAVIALAFGATTQSSFAQTTSATTPVGFVTMSVSGTGGTKPTAFTFTSLGLVNPIAFQSTTTTSVGGTTAIVDSAATWANNAYNSATAGAPPSHFVEILSGPAAGAMYDIVTTDGAGKSLTVSPALAAGVTAGVSYAIRPHWTLASVFGTGASVALQGGDSTSADQVQLWRGTGFVSYFYNTGRGFRGWVQNGNATVDASATVLYPEDGIVIARNQSAGVNVILNGVVKTGQTLMNVQTGYSLLGNVYASGMTLGNSNIFTNDPATGVASGDSTTADQVMFWNGTGFVSYFYNTGRGFRGWVQNGNASVDASATAIPTGTAIFIQRNGAPFTWVAPQFPATFN